MSAHSSARSLTVLIRNVSLFLLALACTFTLRAGAQVTALDKQLEHIDFGVSGAGEFSRSVSGPVVFKGGGAPNQGQVISDSPSNTVGALVNIRYIAKPYVGFEFNFGYARYTQNFSYRPYGVQNNADEYTLGYVVTPPHTIFGLQPFASVGAGTTKFTPTGGGGQNLKTQARATYYYSVGLQDEIIPHFGVRASFRQAFYMAPDFGQNYLSIYQHTFTSEPTLGFYVRF